ncbi:MAG: hypothetical protein WED05_05645 [Candidatus Atabeyarchaeum deiterrae]
MKRYAGVSVVAVCSPCGQASGATLSQPKLSASDASCVGLSTAMNAVEMFGGASNT